MASQCDHDMDDGAGRKQTPARMGGGPRQPSPVAVVDHGSAGVGSTADERGAVVCVCPESPEVDKIVLERAIWRACWDLFITVEEAEAAIEKYCGPQA